MINVRNAYDQELEKIIEHNEYLFNPFEEPFKPSYLDYNSKYMKPLFTDRLTGYERTIAEYHKNERRKITSLNEEDCMKLLKFIFPDIYKIEENPPYDSIDFHVPSSNLYIEHKERGKEDGRIYYQEDGGITFDKPKYDSLMEQEHPYLINSTGIGLFIWNLRLLGELEWTITHKSPKGNKGIKRNQTETNPITYLPYEKCNDLTYLLLQYT
jgi:hypothetical protein